MWRKDHTFCFCYETPTLLLLARLFLDRQFFKRKRKKRDISLKEMLRTIGDTEAVRELGLMVVVSVSLNRFLPHSRVAS